MRIAVTTIFVDDQEKALHFYTAVLGLAKKADFSSGTYRWLTVSSAEEKSLELQLALNDNPAAKTYQQALFEQRQPALMLSSDDLEADAKAIRGRGGEFTMEPTKVPGATIARLKDTCGNLIQISQLADHG